MVMARQRLLNVVFIQMLKQMVMLSSLFMSLNVHGIQHLQRQP